MMIPVLTLMCWSIRLVVRPHCRIDPRHASGRLRAARCWSSPRVAYLC
jgi:hypothetical protein